MPVRELPKDLHSPHHFDAPSKPSYWYHWGGSCRNRSHSETKQGENEPSCWIDLLWDCFFALNSFAGATRVDVTGRQRTAALESTSSCRRLLHGKWVDPSSRARGLPTAKPSFISDSDITISVELQQRATPSTFADFAPQRLCSAAAAWTSGQHWPSAE